MWRWIIDGMRRDGRIGRARYLAYVAAPCAAVAAIVAVGSLPGYNPDTWYGWIAFALLTIVGIVATAIVCSSTARRLHDLGLSGRWCIALAVPPVGFVLIVWALLAPGSPEPNQYGNPPGR